jgi:hypothetical protein
MQFEKIENSEDFELVNVVNDDIQSEVVKIKFISYECNPANSVFIPNSFFEMLKLNFNKE